MIFFYVGIGFAMMTSIISNFQIATTINKNQYTIRNNNVNSSKLFIQKENDKKFLQMLNDIKGIPLGSGKQICEKLSLGKSYVSEIIKLNDLGEKTKTFVMEKNITSRDILRDLSSGKKTLSEVAKIVSSTHKQEYRRSKSVFRIGILDGEYIVQKNFLDKLTKEQKKSLKKELDLIISEHLSY